MLLIAYLASEDGSVFDDAGRMDLNAEENICNSYHGPNPVFLCFLVCITNTLTLQKLSATIVPSATRKLSSGQRPGECIDGVEPGRHWYQEAQLFY